jgi:predicted kinase
VRIGGVVHRVFLVGGPGRVGKSSLAQRLLLSDGIPWLPTDVLRTVLRRVLPELDELDQGNVWGTAVGELMYPHIEQAVEVCNGCGSSEGAYWGVTPAR